MSDAGPESIIGYGCASTQKKASDSAVGELHERIWSNPSVQHHLGKTTVHITNLHGEKLANAPISDIWGLTKLDSCTFKPDATGFAFASNKESAVTHGLFELLERHFLAQFWDGTLKLKLLLNAPKVRYRSNITISSFCSTEKSFCISTIESPTFLAIGSACSPTVQNSYAKSLAEAIMIHTEYVNHGHSVSLNGKSRHRKTIDLLKTNNYRSKVMRKFIESCVDDVILPVNEFEKEAVEIAYESSISINSIKVAEIYSENGICVRVGSSATKNPYFEMYDIDLPML